MLLLHWEKKKNLYPTYQRYTRRNLKICQLHYREQETD